MAAQRDDHPSGHAASPAVRAWLGDSAGEDLVVSDWCSTEGAAALSINVRTGVLVAASRALASRNSGALVHHALRVVEVIRADLRTAAQLAELYGAGLRAGDALRLAVAARHEATLCTLDVRQIEAGRTLGIDTVDPLEGR